MYCTKCGIEVREGDIYCYQCGTRTGKPPLTYLEPKRLMRSRYEGKIAGVCAGVAKYLDLDPTFVRLIWLVLIFCPPSVGIIAYIIAWIVMPKEPPQLTGTAEAVRAY